MKKSFAMALVLLFLVVTAVPRPGLAAEPKITLEEAIQKVKTLFDTSVYKNFTSSYDTYDNHSYWELNWDGKPGGLDVRIDAATGDIVSIYQFRNDDTIKGHSRLPSVKYEDAKKSAIGFLKKVAPDKYTSLRLDEGEVDKYNPYNYDFNFIRQIEGIDFPSNSATVRINSQNGIVESYDLNWEEYNFPDPSKILSIEEAGEIYSKQLGIRLIYKRFGDEIKLVYQPDYIHSIDAVSGNTVKAEDMGPLRGMGAGGDEQYAAMKKTELTPEEEKELSELEGLITENDAVRILQNKFPFLKGMTLDNSNMNSNKDKRYWYISFTSDESKEVTEGTITYAYFTLNAKTGEISSFNIRRKTFVDSAKDIGQDKAIQIANDFIKQEQPERFKNTVLDTKNIVQDYRGNYQIHYDRVVDGIAFPDNGFNITVDKNDGMVIQYQMSWEDHEFPKPDKILTTEDANNVALKNIGLKLQYSFKLNQDYAIKFQKENEQQVLLIYRLDIQYPYGYIYVDAYSGSLLDRNGKPIQKNSPLTDIEDSPYKEDIEILYGKGAITGDSFKPKENITQKDFLSMLVKAMDMGGYMEIENLPGGYEDIYTAAIQNRIIDKNEIDPDKVLTVDDGVRYAVRSLMLGDIAELNVYSGNGYLLLAKGLHILDGSEDGQLTKGMAAHIIVNTMRVMVTW